MLQQMINKNKTNWDLMLFYALSAYRTSAKTTISLTPFQLVYGEEVVLLIECEIPSLKLVIKLLHDTSIEEELLLHIHSIDETTMKLEERPH